MNALPPSPLPVGRSSSPGAPPLGPVPRRPTWSRAPGWSRYRLDLGYRLDLAYRLDLGTRLGTWRADLGRVRARLPLTLIYLVVITTGHAGMALAPVAARQQLLAAASTNVSHLLHYPLLVLPGSALLFDEGLVFWLGFIGLMLGGLEWRWGWRRTLLVAAGGHVLGTLVSEALTAIRVIYLHLPLSAAHQSDVGVSYFAFAAASAVLIVHSWWFRGLAMCLLGSVLPWQLIGIDKLQVAPLGHAVAVAFGLGAGLFIVLRNGGTAQVVEHQAADADRAN